MGGQSLKVGFVPRKLSTLTFGQISCWDWGTNPGASPSSLTPVLRLHLELQHPCPALYTGAGFNLRSSYLHSKYFIN